MDTNKQLVVVLARNYSTGLSVVRSLGDVGYTVDLVASSYKKGNAHIISSSKYLRNCTEVVTKNIKEGGDDPQLLDALLKYSGESQKPVLFPTDDYTTSVMDRNRSLLEDTFIMPTIVGGGDGCLTEHMAKTYQAGLARSAGLLTPQEWVIPLNTEEILIPEDMVYPCFVKPMESVSGYKKEMAKCASEQELLHHLKALKARYADRSILVQEFLQIDNEIDFSGVCLDQEIIIPAIIKKWNVAKYEKGVTLAGRVVPTEELGELQEKVVKMLKAFRYVGMFDMELNIVGDKIYFNEVNLRSGGPNFAYFMSGVNLPALFVKEALGEKHSPQDEKVSEYGKSFLYEKVAWEDYVHGFMTKQALEDRLAAADITLLNYDKDPAPGKLFTKQMKASMLKSQLKKIKRRWVKRIKRWKKELRRTLRPAIKLLRKTKYTLMGYPQMKEKNRRNPFAENPRVLVAGRNFCSNLTMARSLGMAGYEVEILRIFQVRPKWQNLARYLRPDTFSKYVKAYHVCISNRKAQRIVKKLIQIADPYRKMLLIPADDLVANIADEYMGKLSAYYVMPNVNNVPGEIGRLMSKEVQKELAESAGLPVVNSCVIRTYNHQFEIPESVTYPCFIKPNISKNSSKSRMRRCDSREELEQTLTEFSRKKDIEMLVEDFMQIEKEYSILGLSTKDGVVSPGFFGAEMGGHDAHRGVAMVGRILPTSEAQQLIDDITKFVASLQYNGLFDVDLIQTPDGKLYFTELNLRYGASGHAVTLSGANLPGMFADYMLKDKPIDLSCKVTPGKTFISEKIMLDEYMNGYLTKAEMKQQMKSADIHFIFDPQDPAAYRHFKKFYPAADVMKMIRQFKAKKVENN